MRKKSAVERFPVMAMKKHPDPPRRQAVSSLFPLFPLPFFPPGRTTTTTTTTTVVVVFLEKMPLLVPVAVEVAHGPSMTVRSPP